MRVNRIGKHEIKYYINEEKRTVVAKIDGTQFDLDNKLGKLMISVRDNLYIDPFGLSDDYALKPSYTAKATCAPEDTFDVEVGKKIAFIRLQEKYNLAYIKKLARIEKTNSIVGSILIREGEKRIAEIENNSKYMEELISKGE